LIGNGEKLTRRRFGGNMFRLAIVTSFALWALACAAAWLAPATAQTFPAHTVRIVVPYLPGGSADAQVRTLAEELQKKWGKPVVLENKPGAGTTIGAAYVANSAPDGYTLYIASTSHTIVPSLYRSLPYDPLKSFEPVSLLATSPFLLMVAASSPIKTVADLVDLAKSKPGILTFATSGNGGTTHLAAELFKSRAMIDTIHVPFNGAPPSFTAVLGGHVDYVLGDITALPLAKEGQMRVLAVTSAERSPLLPEVPTFKEAGFDGVVVTNWSAIVVAANTPKDIVEFLNRSIVEALATPEVQDAYKKLGFVATPSTPEQLAAQLQSEVAKYAAVTKTAGLKPN
jgi:tripartite-type tricarboxylate transporter receptor subunit TctC